MSADQEKEYKQKWNVIRTLGRGGQGEAHIVTRNDGSKKKKEQYVLKEILTSHIPARLTRFEREARTLESLSHPNILKLVDFDINSNPPYMVTELCSGESLEKTKNKFWKDSPTATLSLFKEICLGIAEAHKHNIIHRDLKPDNILLKTDTGPAVVGDFGLCLLLDENEDRVTGHEEQVGARFFMAPEFENGLVLLENISVKGDVYSLGKILYWLFSGKKFNREKFRLETRNLRKLCNNPKMEYVNELLDKMITISPDDRMDINEVLKRIPELTRLLTGNYNLIEKGFPQNCIYCGVGQYKRLAINKDQSFNEYGLEPGQGSKRDWRAFTCNYCGNVQTFRIDFCENKDWLDEEFSTLGNNNTSNILMSIAPLKEPEEQILANTHKELPEKYPNFFIQLHKKGKSKPDPKYANKTLGTYPNIHFNQNTLEINNFGDEAGLKIKIQPIFVKVTQFGEEELKIEFKDIMLLKPGETKLIDYSLLQKTKSNTWVTHRDSKDGILDDYAPLAYVYENYDSKNPCLLTLNFQDNKYRSYSQIIKIGKDFAEPEQPTRTN